MSDEKLDFSVFFTAQEQMALEPILEQSSETHGVPDSQVSNEPINTSFLADSLTAQQVFGLPSDEHQSQAIKTYKEARATECLMDANGHKRKRQGSTPGSSEPSNKSK